MVIKELLLYSNDLDQVRSFYHELLCIPIQYEDSSSIEFKMGYSILKFELREEVLKPYHFAMNIPSNMEQEALEWLSCKTEILPFMEELIIDFTDWNARAIYCLDFCGNIIEFIARRNLKQFDSGVFDYAKIQCISEIGLACENIEPIYKMLKEKCDIPFYYGAKQCFCAVGDELGLFILVDKTKRFWFPSKALAKSENFKLIMIEKDRKFQVDFNSKGLKIIELYSC